MHCRLRVGRTDSSEPRGADRRRSTVWARHNAQPRQHQPRASATGSSAAWRQRWHKDMHTYRPTRNNAHVSVEMHGLYLEWESSCSWLTAGGRQPGRSLANRFGERAGFLPGATNDWTAHTQTDAIAVVERVLRCAKGPAARAMSERRFNGCLPADQQQGTPNATAGLDWPSRRARWCSSDETDSEPWCVSRDVT